MGVDAALSCHARHRGAGLPAHLNQLGLRRLVIDSAPASFVIKAAYVWTSEPGVKTLWLGLQRITDFASGLRFIRDSAET